MPPASSQPSLFGLSYGWSYALSAFTLTVCGCLPLALIVTMGSTAVGPERVNTLVAGLLGMALVLAGACTLSYFTVLRRQVQWRNRALMLMWCLSALGMVGWWKL